MLYHFCYPQGKGHVTDRLVKQLAVPHAFRNQILLGYHDSIVGAGHQGIERMYQHVRLKYDWHGMFQDTHTYVKSSPDCQQAKHPIHARRVPLKPLPFPDRVVVFCHGFTLMCWDHCRQPHKGMHIYCS